MINIKIGFYFFFVVAVSFIVAPYWLMESNQRTVLNGFQWQWYAYHLCNKNVSICDEFVAKQMQKWKRKIKINFNHMKTQRIALNLK